jgi:linoleoyl-CoA desaturase
MVVERSKYLKSPDDEEIFAVIKTKTNTYFKEKGISKFGSIALFARGIILSLVAVTSYISLLLATDFIALQVSYLLFGFCLVVAGMTLGHDAAHHCLTGKAKWDNLWFTAIFCLQGMNPLVWRIKHNSSHHLYPNISNMDSDLEVTTWLRLSPYQRKRMIHRYQHLYAPLFYMCTSLVWIFAYDFSMLLKHRHGNLLLPKSRAGVGKVILIKFFYISLYLLIPYYLSDFDFYTILMAFLVMHALLSLFLTFTFFISHHITHTHYASVEYGKTIRASWLTQQIASTADFHPHSTFFNCIFGGFHAHVAHHLLPGVSHVHYPELTRMIKSVLKENDISYNAVTFLGGVRLHLKHLRNLGRQQ